jgi:predicted lysophospholipase L1 biosynthesis ABC-type transport system permease subunit
LPSPTQVGDTITLEIDGREIDIEVETVPDVYENYLRKQG